MVAERRINRSFKIRSESDYAMQYYLQKKVKLNELNWQ